MMKTLLSKTLAKFLVCTAVVFVLTTPLFYFITKYFYAEDMIDIIESVEQGHGIPALDLERDVMEGVMLQFVLIFLVLSVSLFIIMRFVTRRLWQPFDDTLRKTERFNLAQGEVPRFVKTDVLEFDRMNRSLIQLMEKDRETFRIQKEFSENASHELQTPLAVMRSKLDMLMQEDLNGRQMQLVADLDLLTTRMSNLNRNLLLLAKIDNAQYAAQEEVDVASLLSVVLSVYDVFSHGIPVDIKDLRARRNTTVKANSVLLEILLKNLIVNAIRNTPAGGDVRIVIDNSLLSISNTAATAVPLDASMLFRRFRSDNMQGSGNGLGLAIVKAICDFHGWTVSYGFADSRHCFVVDFSSAVK